jgi:2-keto-4-pentenoate hydratase/2-oxohepta-3-ene-1,7-dioic acid hydratase in catechol pathway
MNALRLATRLTDQGSVPVHVRGDGHLRAVDPGGDTVPDLLTAVRRWGTVASLPPPEGDHDWTSPADARLGIPLRGMQTVIGIGLNFVGHAADLKAPTTRLPTLFYKGPNTLIGPGDPILLPDMSQRVTAEAELALVIGRPASRVAVDDALSYVAGVCCALDQTAEDILLEDARLLTLAKNFESFLSLGPELADLEELSALNGSLDATRVETWLNGECVRSGTVSDMRFGPAELVSFISHVIPLEPGDVISTGTPGAVRIEPGDTVECRVAGLRPLSNPVIRHTSAT